MEEIPTTLFQTGQTRNQIITKISRCNLLTPVIKVGTILQISVLSTMCPKQSTKARVGAEDAISIPTKTTMANIIISQITSSVQETIAVVEEAVVVEAETLKARQDSTPTIILATRTTKTHPCHLVDPCLQSSLNHCPLCCCPQYL